MAAVSPSRQLIYGVQWNCSVLVGSLLAACHAGPAPPAHGTTRFLAPPATVLLGRWEYVPPARADVAPITVVASRRRGDTLVIEHARQGNDAGPFAAGPGVMFLRTAARVRP